MLEELLALGHTGAEYDAWLIRIGEGDQFGSGFVAVNPNSKIPALVDRSGPTPIRVFESGAILVYLAEKFGAFLPTEAGRARRMPVLAVLADGQRALLGGGFGHFYAYAPVKIEYAIDRYAMETKRQLDVLDRQLADSEYVGGRRLHDRRHGDLALVRRPGAGAAVRGGRVPVRAGIQERAALGRCDRRPAGGETRAHGEPASGEPSSSCTSGMTPAIRNKTQDKLAARGSSPPSTSERSG